MPKLFEKVDGLLVEVHPDKAEETRKGRRVSRVVACEIDVLFTAEEEAARDAEEAATAEAAAKAEASQQEAEKRRAVAAAKLEALGLTLEDIAALRLSL